MLGLFRRPSAPTLPLRRGTFGTSRWQLYAEATPFAHPRGRGRPSMTTRWSRSLYSQSAVTRVVVLTAPPAVEMDICLRAALHPCPRLPHQLAQLILRPGEPFIPATFGFD